MARTKPSEKAKGRATMLQKEVEIDPEVDPEMKATLARERGRRVAFKKVGEAQGAIDTLSSKLLPPKPKKPSLLRKIGQKVGLAGPSEEDFDEMRAKVQKRKDQAAGARYMRKQAGN